MSRELDAKVAEAMGWVEVRESGGYILGRPGIAHFSTRHNLHEVPHYSTDLNAAFEFVEWMRKSHDSEFDLCGALDGDWCAQFVVDDGGCHETYRSKFIKSPARAICLASLAALGIEVEAWRSK